VSHGIMTYSDKEAFAQAVVAGDVRSAARLMRLADDREPLARDLLSLLFPHTGRAHIVGITGNPGAGKSSLVDNLITSWRGRGLSVGVVAVDPSSPFSGGAVLGDRIRMMRHATDPGVFIRSLATRGALGGLSRSAGDIATVMDAMGLDRVLIETVGVGQDEVDVVRMAHTTVVVMVPGLGDEIQILKAGILEIADIFAVNKADKPGADRLAMELQSVQHLGTDQRHIPIVRTVATAQEGIEELVDAIETHAGLLRSSGELQERDARRLTQAVFQLVHEAVDADLTELFDRLNKENAIIDELLSRRSAPATVAQRLLELINKI